MGPRASEEDPRPPWSEALLGPPCAGSAQQDYRQTGQDCRCQQEEGLMVLRRELGDFVAYGGVGGGRGCLTTTTHVKMGERRSGMEWAPRCLLPRRRSAVIVPSKAR